MRTSGWVSGCGLCPSTPARNLSACDEVLPGALLTVCCWHARVQVLKAEQPMSMPPSSFPPLPGEPGKIEWNYVSAFTRLSVCMCVCCGVGCVGWAAVLLCIVGVWAGRSAAPQHLCLSPQQVHPCLASCLLCCTHSLAPCCSSPAQVDTSAPRCARPTLYTCCALRQPPHHRPTPPPPHRHIRTLTPPAVPGSPPAQVKFLVGRDGVALRRYKPGFDPLQFESDVRLALAGKPPLPSECFAHPGRKVCKVEQYL